MDIREKLNVLGQAAQYDDLMGRGLFAPPVSDDRPARDMTPCVSHLTTPDGRRKPILKVLQTSACENNCRYCAFPRRARFSARDAAAR